MSLNRVESDIETAKSNSRMTKLNPSIYGLNLTVREKLVTVSDSIEIKKKKLPLRTGSFEKKFAD